MMEIEDEIGDRVPGLQGLAFADFEIAHGADGYGDRQAVGSVIWGLGMGCGPWEIEGLVLKAVAPIRTPTIPVMISFCIPKGAGGQFQNVPFAMQNIRLI
jgi:hypothetical protein